MDFTGITVVIDDDEVSLSWGSYVRYMSLEEYNKLLEK